MILEDCELVGNKQQNGLFAGGEAVLAVRRCRFRAMGGAVCIKGKPDKSNRIIFEECVFQPEASGEGIVLLAGSDPKFLQCDIIGGKTGVTASRSRGTFERCRFRDQKSRGMLATKCSATTLKECEFSQERLAIQTRLFARVLVEDCQFADCQRILKKGLLTKRPICLQSIEMFLENANIENQYATYVHALRKALADYAGVAPEEILSSFTFREYRRLYEFPDEDDLELQYESAIGWFDHREQGSLDDIPGFPADERMPDPQSFENLGAWFHAMIPWLPTWRPEQ